MDIQISRDSDFPIRQQLTEQIVFLIATGRLRPGQDLPSVRALARRLKIHHNTVSQAYQDLVSRDWLVRRQGSRMMVRSAEELSDPPASKDLDDLINETIQAARQHGYTVQQLRQRVQERLMAQSPDHILVVSVDDPGMRHLLRVELRENLPYPVEACSLEELSANRSLSAGALVTTPLGLLPDVRTLVSKDRAVVGLTFSEAKEHFNIVRSLERPSLIAVVSVSETFLLTARGLLAPLIGQRHRMREYLLPTQEGEGLEWADVVFCDSITKSRVKSRNLVHYRMVSPKCIERLEEGMKP